MVNATAWSLGNSGYAYLSNETNISVIKAAVTGWQQSGEGIAAFFMFTFIIILAGSIIYIRTQKAIPSIFAMLMTTFLIQYYKILDFTVTIGVMRWHETQILSYIYIFIIVLFGIAFYYIWQKGGE